MPFTSSHASHHLHSQLHILPSPSLPTAPHLSMEERVAPPAVDENHDGDDDHIDNHEHDLLPITTESTLRSGTYVVQVPKDQVYRVPPPENALIAERRRQPSRNRRFCSSFCWLVFVIVVAVILGLIAALCFIFLKPNFKDPTFSIEHFLVKNSTSHPDYNITLKAENPNGNSISFKQGGDDVSLHFKQQKIAAGKYPSFDQDDKNSRVFFINLHGSNIDQLPKEIEKSMKSSKNNSKEHVSLSLQMNNVPVRLKSETRKITVTCNLTVDSLAKDTHVLSQDCQTKH